MTEHTTPAGDDPAELDKDQGGELVPFPTPATPMPPTRPTAGPPPTRKPATRTTRTLCR
jgi:hypothetical protein